MLRMNDQKKRSILNWIRALRPVPLALTRVAAAFFFPGTAGQPAHIGALAVRARLEEGAREYLRRTAEILGDRYDGAFYRAAIETQIGRYTETPLRTESDPRACFVLLAEEDGSGAAEALAFLDEFDSGDANPPSDLFMLAESLGNAPTARFFLSELSGNSPVSAQERSGRICLPAEFILLFSLVSLLAAVLVPASPLTALGGKFAAVEEFFRRLAQSLFAPCGIRHAAIRGGNNEFFLPLAHTPLEEKVCVVLLL